MASLADVFTENERTNWLKAWLAVDIAKSGLEQFVDNEARTFKTRIYNTVRPSPRAPATVCTGCHTANLLRCPTPGICNKRGATSFCKSMHDTPAKRPRPCPLKTCCSVRDEIIKEHRYRTPSWCNTEAQKWGLNPWEIAKCYFPKEGYVGKSSVKDTDFNGVVSFLLNCRLFDSKFSFSIAPAKPSPPCLLTKAREICKTVRHSPVCKVTDTDLQDYFTILTNLLTDPTCLAHDGNAQDAVTKLRELKKDKLKITTEEMIYLLDAAQETLRRVGEVAEEAMNEMRSYIENCRMELEVHSAKCKKELDEHTDKCKDAIDVHMQKVAESNYEESCEELIQCLKQLYNDKFSHVKASPLNDRVDVKLNDVYISPKVQLMCNDKGNFKKAGAQVTKYKELFVTGGTCYRRIFMQGEAGTGKSTFTAKLVLDWCGQTTTEPMSSEETITESNTQQDTAFFDDLEALQDYKFVFHITLRDSVKQYDVSKMIKEQIIDSIYAEEDREKFYKLLNEVMKRERCLVVLDGLDEWCGPGGQHSLPSLVTTHSQCILLITTRPWKLADDKIKSSEIDNLLELKGINDPFALSRNILARCFNKDELNDKQLAFELYIRKHGDLQRLFSAPMLHSLIVRSWAEGTQFRGSQCELFSLLLDSLLKKSSNEPEHYQDPPFPCFAETQYIKPNIEHFNALSKAAFDFLFSETRDNSLVFNVNNLMKYLTIEQKEFALKSGVLSETLKSTLLRSSSTCSFIHKSVQEFLAAYHISCNINVIDDIIAGYLSKHADAYLDISQLFIFLCGLNTSAAHTLSCLMDEHNNAHTTSTYIQDPKTQFFTRDRSDLLQRIILSGYKEAVANHYTTIQLKLSHITVKVNKDNSYYEGVQYIWKPNTSNLRSLIIKCGMDWGTNKVHDPLVLDEKKSVVDIELGPCALDGQEIGTSSASRFKLDLSQCCNLEQLRLCESVILLPNALGGLKTLKRLEIGCKCEGLDLAPLEHLESIDLSKEVTLLPMSLKNYKSLKQVTFKCPYDGLDLSLFEQLATIYISQVVKVLPKPLRNHNQLKRVTLCNFDFTNSEKSDIQTWFLLNSADLAQCSDTLPVSPSIQHIELRDVRCSSTWLRSLFKALLTLGHQVNCLLDNCYISSCVENEDNTLGTEQFVSVILNTNTVSIGCTKSDIPVPIPVWETLHDLNIKNLCLRHLVIEHQASSLSRLLTSLSQLETLYIRTLTYIDIQLPPSVKYLVFCYHLLTPFNLRDLLKRLSARINSLDCKLTFGYPDILFDKERIRSLDKYKDELEALEQVEVKLFRIYDRRDHTRRDLASAAYVVDDDDDDDDDNFKFVDLGVPTYISIRLRVNREQG